MNQKELVRLVSLRSKVPQTEVDFILGEILDSIVLSLSSGDAVNLRRFGSFEVREQAPRKVKVPNHGTVDLPSRHTVAFKASPILKEHVHERASD